MKRNNFYVTYGTQPGIYIDKERIEQDVPFEKFGTYRSAQFFMMDKEMVMYHDYTNQGFRYIRGIDNVYDSIAYIDGSYNKESDCYGLGIVFQYSHGIEEFSEGDSDSRFGMRHITGQLMAAIKAVTYAVLVGCKSITLVYDYIGVEKFATGEWRANQPWTEEYQMAMAEAALVININFVKVNKNSGIIGYDRADMLAKRGRLLIN